jgi:hypothetical protein
MRCFEFSSTERENDRVLLASDTPRRFFCPDGATGAMTHRGAQLPVLSVARARAASFSMKRSNSGASSMGNIAEHIGRGRTRVPSGWLYKDIYPDGMKPTTIGRLRP